MNCPRCARELAEKMVSLHASSACPGCGGVWVPFESVDAVLPRLAELAPPEGLVPPAEAGQKGLRCPSCGGEMAGVKAHGAGGALVRTCLVCFGRWVDGSDLVRARGHGLRRLWRAILRALKPKERPAPRPEPAEEGTAPPRPQPSAEESSRTEPPKG